MFTTDGIEVFITHADAGRAPDSPVAVVGGQFCGGSTAVWYKPINGEWQVSGQRSAIKVCDIIKHSKAEELKEKLA